MKKKINNPYEVDLAAACMEIGANLVVEYNELRFRLTSEHFEDMKEHGIPTHVYGCIAYGLAKCGMTEAEGHAFLKDAVEKDVYPNVTFEAPDDEGLHLTTPDAAPEFDKLVKDAEERRKKASGPEAVC